MTILTISNWAAQYAKNGLKAIYDQQRSGRPVEIDGSQRAKVTALAYREAPEGYERWNLRLLANKAVELGYCEHLSHTGWPTFSKKNELKPHLKRTWCIGKLDSRFLAHMEQILSLYALPYDPAYLVICFDERPCSLIGDQIEPWRCKPGKCAKNITLTKSMARVLYWLLLSR